MRKMLASEQIVCEVCRTMAELCTALNDATAAVIVSEESLIADHAKLAHCLAAQPVWSDVPVIVLSRSGAESLGLHDALRIKGNLTVIERPMRVSVLLSVVRAALRSRQQQYSVRDLLVQQQQHALALQAKEARLQFALAAGRLGSWEVELASREMTCSDICKANYGRKAGEAFSYDDLFASIHADDRTRVSDAVDAALRGERDYDIEYRTVWPDSSLHWVMVRGQVTARRHGQPVRMSGVSLDITKQKNAEMQLRDADKRKDEFIALLAHELRNPLAPLRNAVGIIERADGDAQLVRDTSELMERQLSHMVRLIDDLLDISRLSRDKLELRRARVLLSDVVASAVETVRPMIAAAGHRLSVTLPAEPIYLDADLTRLSQVFGNLLGNSAKYTAHGGRILLAAERDGEWVRVSITDNGIGIPHESLPTVFEMFSQVDRTIERSTGGLGIGLALVQGLVRMHSGTVEVTSPGDGLGSTFTVRLPVAAAPAPSVKGADASAEPRPARRVLVVDDNRDSAKTMAMMLRMHGDETGIAHDGLAAVEEAERMKPDVILMDVGMPRLNGYEATRRIRQQPWGRELTIIALTGWGQEGDRIASREAGCDGHLVKPVDFGELEQLVTQLTTTP